MDCIRQALLWSLVPAADIGWEAPTAARVGRGLLALCLEGFLKTLVVGQPSLPSCSRGGSLPPERFAQSLRVVRTSLVLSELVLPPGKWT